MSNVNIDRQLKKEAKAAFSKDEDMSKRDTGPKFKTPSNASSTVVEEEAKKCREELFDEAALEKRRSSVDWLNKLSIVLLLFVLIPFFTSKDSNMEPSISYINFENQPSFKTLPERDSSGSTPLNFKIFLDITTEDKLSINWNSKPKFISDPNTIQSNDSADKLLFLDLEARESSDIGFSARFLKEYDSNQNSSTITYTSVNRKLDLVDSLMCYCQNTWDKLNFYDIKNIEPLVANQVVVDSLKQINSLRLIVDIDLLEYTESSHQNEYGKIQNTASIKYILKGIKPKTREVLFAEPIQANVTMEQPAGFDLDKTNTPLFKCSPAMLLVKKQVLQKSITYLKPYLDKL